MRPTAPISDIYLQNIPAYEGMANVFLRTARIGSIGSPATIFFGEESNSGPASDGRSWWSRTWRCTSTTSAEQGDDFSGSRTVQNGMTTVVSRGEEASPVADGAERGDDAVFEDIRKVFERAEDETGVATVGEPSPLPMEVRQSLGLRFAWGDFAWGQEESLIQAVRTRRQPENIRAAGASPAQGPRRWCRKTAERQWPW
jgi:hypothetical protein